MPTFRYLSVKGMPLFADETFKLDRTGVTVIHGLNMNSGAKAGTGRANTNFVGKSLFFSNLPGVFHKDALGVKAKDRAKEGTREVGVTSWGYDWRVVQKPKGHVIYQRPEGSKEPFQDVTPKKPADREALLEKIVGVDELTASVTSFIDNTKPNRLRAGDTAVRRQFFSDFFRLASTEFVGKLVKAQKAENKRTKAVLLELQMQEAAYQQEDTEALEERAVKLRKKLKVVKAGLSRLYEKQTFIAWAERYSVVLQSRAARLTPEMSAADLEDAVGRVQRLSTKARDQARSFTAQQEYRGEYRIWKKSAAALQAYIDEHNLSEEDHEFVKGEGVKCDARIRRCKDYFERARFQELDMRNEIKRATEEATRIVRTKGEELEAKRHAVNCKTCGQKLPKALLTKAELAEGLEILEQKNTAVAKMAELLASMDKKLEDADELWGTRLRKSKARRGVVESRLALYANAPHVPQKPDRPDNSIELPDDFDYEKTVARHQRLRRLASDLNDLSGSEVLETRLAQAAEYGWDAELDTDAMQEGSERALALQAKLTSVTTRLEMGRADHDRYLALVERIKELESKLSGEDELVVLDDAFNSSRGVKQLAIQAICRQLETQVNHYAKSLFPEPYVFSFDLDTQFNILVSRMLGGKELTSDVRMLSGAESGMFSLVLALALRSFLPESARSNVMILDEVNANFSPEMTEVFARALPRLRKIVPHFIVITPRSTDDYGEEASYFTVVKKGASSTIVEGRAETIRGATAKKRKAKAQ